MIHFGLGSIQLALPSVAGGEQVFTGLTEADLALMTKGQAGEA